MAGPASLLLLLPEVAHDVVQVLAHQVAPSKVFAHQVPPSQLPNQLLHIRQPAQSSVRSLGKCEILFLKIGTRMVLGRIVITNPWDDRSYQRV